MVRVRKIALLGFPAVGKSSLASRFVSKTFSEDYCTTIESLTITKLTLPNGQEFLVHLYDTMGVTEQPTVPDDYMLMDAWVIVFDVTNRRSFNVVMDLYQKLRDSGAQRNPIMLVGNKTDLATERIITAAEAQRSATELGVSYMEASAKDNSHVSDIFRNVIIEIERNSGEPQPQEKQGDCILL